MMKEKNRPQVSDIFLPRDEDGRIEGLVSIVDNGKNLEGNPLRFPKVPYAALQDGNYTHPLLDLRDFEVGGKYYGQISYEFGIPMEAYGVMPSGNMVPLPLDKIIFFNSLLNTPQMIQEIRREGIPPQQVPALQQLSSELLSRGILAPPEPDDDKETDFYISSPKGGRCRVCNFSVKVKTLRCIVDDKQIKYEIELALVRRNILGQKKEHVVCVPQGELENLADYLNDMVPSFALASETPRAGQLLAEYIRNQLDEAPRITVYRNSGWNQLDDRHIFVHANVPAFSNAKSECEQTIVAEKMSPVTAFQEALGILSIGKLDVLLPLMLTALLGPLFQLFADAGYIPHFVTYLYGLSGSLKTAVSLVFYRFYVGQKHSTFRDTRASIDVAVGDHYDQMLLVDDFQPAVVAADGANMRKVLEHLIRLYGDDIAKRRSNGRATATYGKAPRGSCLVTGESLSGSYSSLLRCLLVPISRGDIDGQLLRRYQERPGLWSTNYIYFLPWIGTNWDRFVDKIRTEFPNLRSYFSSVTSEPRLADTGAVLMLVGEIFLTYGIECGALNREYVQCTLKEWCATIKALLDTTTDASQELDVAKLAREAITGALADESLSVAPDINSFVGRMDGFVHKGLLWIKPQALNRILLQYCATNDLSSVRGAKAVLPELYKRGLIVRDEETKKNSFLKKSPQIPALKTRLRMVAFRCEELFKET